MNNFNGLPNSASNNPRMQLPDNNFNGPYFRLGPPPFQPPSKNPSGHNFHVPSTYNFHPRIPPPCLRPEFNRTPPPFNVPPPRHPPSNYAALPQSPYFASPPPPYPPPPPQQYEYSLKNYSNSGSSNISNNFENKGQAICKKSTKVSVDNCPLLSSVDPRDNKITSVKKSEEWVKSWTEKKIARLDKSRAVKPVNLSEVHQTISEYKILLEKLKQEKSELIVQQLQVLSQQLNCVSYQTRVKKLVTLRRKKRSRMKQRKTAKIKELKLEHDRIDTLRHKVIEEEKEAKIQSSLKKEADSVLKEVRNKQVETNNFLELLAKLKELRQSRLKRGACQGYVSQEHQDEYFTSITDGLQEMLQSQLKEYELEERTLRAMLDMQNCVEPPSNSNINVDKMFDLDTLRKIYFGDHDALDKSLYFSYTAADDSFEMLHNRRRAWDIHLSDSEGSGVPVSWVLPPLEPSKSWKKWRSFKQQKKTYQSSNN